MEKIIVVGSGVAGSIFSYKVLEQYRQCRELLVVYEISKKYTKPCGEAIPVGALKILEENEIPRPPIITYVKHYLIKVNEHEHDIEFEKPVWVIVEKSKWINSIREKISANIVLQPYRMNQKTTNKYLVIDARGPFANPERSIVVWQAYAEAFWPKDSVLLYFVLSTHVFGLVWIFPNRNGLVNIGGGFRGVTDPKPLSIKYLSYTINNIKIIREKYSIININPRVTLFTNNIIRIGEAAGLVMPLGGEGIRPAIYSAMAAVKSLVSSGCKIMFDKYQYANILWPLVSQVRLQKLLMYMAEKHPSIAARLLIRADKELLHQWLEGGIRRRSLLRLLFG